jgi:preprotein translocase subunit SecF
MEFFKPGRQFDFMGQRWFWVPLSLILVAVSTFLTLVWPGPNYGTDFQGGTEVQVRFKQSLCTGQGGGCTEIAQLREAVNSSGFHNTDVVQVGDPSNHEFFVRVQDITVLDDTTKGAVEKALCKTDDPKTLKPGQDEASCPPWARATEVTFSPGGDKIFMRYDGEPDSTTVGSVRQQLANVRNIKIHEGANNPQVVNHRIEVQLQSKGDQLMDQLRQKLGTSAVPDVAERVEWVGPKAGKQLRDSARNSVAIAIVFIMLYLAFRFDLRFAPGVVIACVHDAMVVIGVFVALRKEVTLSTIAAVLTIVGYSMNDTVVVFDRIRENLTKHRGKSFANIINMSVSETLSRTVLTSGATMLSVLAFFIWGTGVIKDLALAMVVGIVAGTYSSIYVAAPITEWIDRQMAKRSSVGRKRLSVRGAQPAKV